MYTQSYFARQHSWCTHLSESHSVSFVHCKVLNNLLLVQLLCSAIFSSYYIHLSVPQCFSKHHQNILSWKTLYSHNCDRNDQKQPKGLTQLTESRCSKSMREGSLWYISIYQTQYAPVGQTFGLCHMVCLPGSAINQWLRWIQPFFLTMPRYNAKNTHHFVILNLMHYWALLYCSFPTRPCSGRVRLHPSVSIHIQHLCFPECLLSGHGTLWSSALLHLQAHQQLLLCCRLWFKAFLYLFITFLPIRSKIRLCTPICEM